MKRKPSHLKRILRGIVITLLVVAGLLYLGLPAAMAVFAMLPTREPVSAAPDGFQEVRLNTEDGVTLAAWYHPPANRAAVILIHGAGGSRAGTRPYATMLVEHGYGVLALDLRGHGESDGETNRFGWQGTRDVGAAVSFLQGRDEVQAIGGLGLSVGGESLLGAASTYPALRAIIADGATQRCTAELLALESERLLVRNFTARVMYATVGLLSGEAPPSPLLDSIQAAGSTQFLLVAAGNEAQETRFNRLFAERLGERAALWVVPGVGHTGAYGSDSQKYSRQVLAFLDANLLVAAGSR